MPLGECESDYLNNVAGETATPKRLFSRISQDTVGKPSYFFRIGSTPILGFYADRVCNQEDREPKYLTFRHAFSR